MLSALSRWLLTDPNHSAQRESSVRVVVESYPPLAFADRRAWSSRIGDWLAASSWLSSAMVPASSLGRRARREAVAAARLDFAEALDDVGSDGAADALDRIAVVRSLHELWHLRAEVFSRIAECHDQTEATHRLAAIDRHFPRRSRRLPARTSSAAARRCDRR